MNKHVAAFVILIFVSNSWAQDDIRKTLRGKIVSDAAELEGIYVLNMNTEKVASTENGGYFSILAKDGDSIMVSSIQIKGKITTLKKEDFEKELFFIKAEAMVHALDEVKIVRYDNLNAYALGIVQKKPKAYTPAERKLRTATGYDAQIGLNTTITLDPILNMLSGRSAMLRKEVDTERKETLMAYISNMFEDKYFIEKLKIPAEYVKGFLYYIVENERFVSAVKIKNNTMATFLMGELALKFKDTIACEGQ